MRSVTKDPGQALGLRLISMFCKATGLPVALYRGRKLLRDFSDSEIYKQMADSVLQMLPDELPLLWYTVLEGDLVVAGCDSPVHDVLIVIGPALPYDCTREAGLSIQKTFGLPADQLYKILDHFQGIGIYSEDELCAALQVYVQLLYMKIDPDLKVLRVSAKRKTAAGGLPVPEIEDQNQTFFDLERQWIAGIRHGRKTPTEQLSGALFEQLQKKAGPHTDMQRYELATSMSLASRSAIHAGVDTALAFSVLQEAMASLLAVTSTTAFRTIFTETAVQFAEEVARLRKVAAADPLVIRIQRYVTAHVHEKITPGILAEALGYTPSYLCARFKEKTGQTISAFVNEYKTEEAKRLLESPGLSTADVAMHLGYINQSYFSKVFKNVTKMTPGEYRASMDVISQVSEYRQPQT